MSTGRSPFERAEDVAGSMAPYGNRAVYSRTNGGYMTRLPADLIRKLEWDSVDRYYCPAGRGAIILVPEGAEVPVEASDLDEDTA
ncbi:MAG: hypothetical protein ABEH78_07995 [Haloferacaceae archaeon]